MIPGIIETGRKFGMQSARQAIAELRAASLIDPERAAAQAELLDMANLNTGDLVGTR